jgi:hypothetical protein
MYNNEIYLKILELISDFESDSKSRSKKAQEELIKICEPIIKQFYCIAKDFGVDIDMDWDTDYNDNRGKITKFMGVEDNCLDFYYEDYCMGESYCCSVYMPIGWVCNNNALESYKNICIEKKLENLQKQETEYKNLLKNIRKEIKRLKNN